MAKRLRESPSQTAGPYIHIGCAPRTTGIDAYPQDLGARMLNGPVEGKTIILSGALFDGDGAPVTDAMVELWQADAAGAFPTGGCPSNFTGFGRVTCDGNGGFSVETIKPGDGAQAPHVTLWIVARGINLGLHTRAYFEGDDHSADPVLQQVPADRRTTLIARQIAPGHYHLDIRLQGEHETVFFDV